MASPEDVDFFQKNGAVLLKNIFNKSWLDKITRGINATLVNPSKYSEKLRTAEGTGYYFNDYCNWEKIEEFRDVVFNSPAAEVARSLMKSKECVFYHEHVLTKDPGTYKTTPWHQDQPYYPIDGSQNVSLWIPIDPVSTETTLQFVKGSHLSGKWFHPRKFATELNYTESKVVKHGRKYHAVPDVEANPDEYEVLKWAVQPGDCLAFHMLTLHGAPSNTTDTPRRVVSLRFLGDDVTLAERPWEVSPPIDGGLRLGDRIKCDTFPLVCSETSQI
ncbi:hypothetical protein CAPTEDRAFT_192845 [Capitella teleta]|uniref:Phytanoyl-CoA dioxygenase n=1 Tax=Capitella teleta TaxID=283909 RepID=R7VFC7_CAPTE|nr:hypothetical protein CAPTEDRAFT_192845 [Capitella teleta]|eukprot:ELU17267.1 hypothetical protein CAPTEDRAFT_192845 [Capitella teleta]